MVNHIWSFIYGHSYMVLIYGLELICFQPYMVDHIWSIIYDPLRVDIWLLCYMYSFCTYYSSIRSSLLWLSYVSISTPRTMIITCMYQKQSIPNLELPQTSPRLRTTPRHLPVRHPRPRPHSPHHRKRTTSWWRVVLDSGLVGLVVWVRPPS